MSGKAILAKDTQDEGEPGSHFLLPRQQHHLVGNDRLAELIGYRRRLHHHGRARGA
jgi:hypothetical protein